MSDDDEITRLRAVVDGLLRGRYVDHLGECDVVQEHPCNCGLNALLAQLDVSPTMGAVAGGVRTLGVVPPSDRGGV